MWQWEKIQKMLWCELNIPQKKEAIIFDMMPLSNIDVFKLHSGKNHLRIIG